MTDTSNNHSQELDLYALFHAIFRAKYLIIFISFLFSFLIALYSLTLPNQFKSNAVLVGVDSPSSGAPNLSQFQGLAEMAGVSLPGASSSKTDLTLLTLRSRDFFKQFYADEKFLINLFAIDSYDKNSQKIILDTNIYKDGEWLNPTGDNAKPTFDTTYNKFFGEHFKLDYDSFSGTVYMSVEHQSPLIAQKWLQDVIKKINTYSKEKDVLEAKKSLEFLSIKLVETNINDLQKGISNLMLQQIQKVNLSEMSDEYALKIVDSPSLPEKKSSPYRSWMVVMGALVGFLSSLLLVITYFYSGKQIILSLLPPKIITEERKK